MKLRLRVPATPMERFTLGCLDSQVGKVVRFEGDTEDNDGPMYVRIVGYDVDQEGSLVIDVEEADGP